MKKLIIVGAVALMAVCSNAAQFSWGVTAIGKTPDGTAAKAGWVSYIMDASTYSTFVGLSADKVAAYVVANNIGTATDTAYHGINATVKTTKSDYGAGDTADAYLVMFDNASAAAANYYAYTATKSGSIPDNGADQPLSYGSFSTAMSDAKSSGGWQSIPEPTSGLLMLLGMAGLALRRRRA